MNIIDIANQANLLADESLDTNKIIIFANDAVARINVKCGANFPFFSANELNTSYAGFNETWQRTLLVPFIVGRIKQQDSSQFEYSDAYGEFTDNLIEFKAKYTIPDSYKDATIQTSYEPDFTGNYFSWNAPQTDTDFTDQDTTNTDTSGDITVTLDGGKF